MDNTQKFGLSVITTSNSAVFWSTLYQVMTSLGQRFLFRQTSKSSKHLHGRFEGVFQSVSDSVQELMRKKYKMRLWRRRDKKVMRERPDAF